MQILIEKDSATKVPREVADADEARAFAHQGFVVHVVNEDGSTSPLADEAPAAEEPAAEPAKKAGKGKKAEG